MKIMFKNRLLISFLVTFFVLQMVSTLVFAEYKFIPPVLLNYKSVVNDRETVFIPQVYGMKDTAIQTDVNKILSADIEIDLKNWEKNWPDMYKATQPEVRSGLHFSFTFDQNYNKENILSVVMSEYSFAGGAHGMAFQYAHNIDLTNGKEILLASLFNDTIDWKKMINAYIDNEIKYYQRDLKFDGIKEDQNYYLSNQGLVIFFNPYEIGPWVEGMPTFAIPYRVISFAFSDKYKERLH
ncbi:MAG: DUF3298 and DUF4163 domain-containing protein [Negativicutes bacterium]|jgi:hypothetical protein